MTSRSCRCSRRSPTFGSPPRPCGAARRRALRRTRRAPRPAARGHARLLRLGQGRRLPDGAPGRSTAPRRRSPSWPASADVRAHDLPRPRRQRRARRRSDARGHPRPAARASAGPPQADRAGRDDLLQVRPAGPRAPQPRGGGRGHAAGRLPRRARQRPRPARASSWTTLSEHSLRRLSRARARRSRLRAASSAPSRPSTSSACWRSARAPRGGREPRLPGRRCARSRGCSRGRRRARCCPPGTASARRWRARRPRRRRRRAAAPVRASSPFFRALVDNLEMTLAKSSARGRARVPRARAAREQTATASGR